MVNITVNAANITGKIRPMHAVGNVPSPSCKGEVENNYLAFFKKAGIPYCRYHDTAGAFGRNLFVDVPNVFRNFDADETDPNNYDFTFTDWLVNRCLENGVKPFYRLGVTIENNNFLKAYRTIPPKDPHKWARICEHIIMHYNEGWASGFNYGIEYWEIWNEPDGGEKPEDNQMWNGTPEQYFELYEIASNHLKNRFPEIKVGGYASCGFYKVAKQMVDPNAGVPNIFNYYFDFFHKFMKHITSPGHESPLDFFSWHSYSANPSDNVIYCNYVREQLIAYGYSNCENICNEWNPGTKNRGKLIDCAYIAANMLAWQRNGLDMAMYYQLRLDSNYCGGFSPEGKVYKAYYAFKAFNALYVLKNEVLSTCSESDVQVGAASDGKVLSIMIANFAEEDKEIELCVENFNSARVIVNRVDAEHDFDEETVNVSGTVKLPANAVYLYRFYA